MCATQPGGRASLGALAVLVLLAGCAGGIRPGEDDARRWQLSGKLGLRAEHLAETALIDWRQCGRRFDIRLAGPLGQTAAHLAGRGEHVVVQMHDREPLVTDDPEGLLLQELGWAIPLRALRYWVRAAPAPGATAVVVPGAGRSRPAAIEQFGWRVDYRDWHVRDGLALPAKLVLQGEGLRATLLIRDWRLSDAVTGCAET